MYAPIALFVFNRIDHARKTIAALAANELARESDLFIFSDGPRGEKDVMGVEAVRQFIRDVTGFRSVTVCEQPRNMGLAAAIIGGVTQLCERYGKAIVVEDDIVTSRYFLRFMNDALRVYENEPRLMHISGCCYPVSLDALGAEPTFFLRVPLCWGWATWKRAWDTYSRDFSIASQFTRSMRRDFDFGGAYPYWKQVTLNRKGKLKTWFVFWYATLYLRDGLALFPRVSLVNNIGHDGSGENCAKTDNYWTEVADATVTVRRMPVAESLLAYAAHTQYFKAIRKPWLHRALQRIARKSSAIRGASTAFVWTARR